MMFFSYVAAKTYCYLHYTSFSSASPMIVLGDAVMEGYTVVFDRANGRIGFAVSQFAGL